MTYYFIKVFNSGHISEGHAILEMVATIDHRLSAANAHGTSIRAVGVKEMIGELFVPIKWRETFRLNGTAVFFSLGDFEFFV